MKSQGDLFKNAGMEKVLLNEMPDWKIKAKVLISEFLEKNDEFTGEDVSNHIIENIGRPYHPNSLGAIFSSCLASKGKVTAIGMTKSKNKSSHSHYTRIWKKVA